MKNEREIMQMLQCKQGQDLIMVDIVVHGSENQIDKLRFNFGSGDSYTEESNIFKNKRMLVTPFIPNSNEQSELNNILEHTRDFASDIGGTKTTQVELWIYTDMGDDDIDYDKIRVNK